MTLEQAAERAISYKHFHRQHMPGVQTLSSIDGPYHLAEMVQDGAVMMELGSYWGESTMFFWLSGKFSKIYAVDPYASDNVDAGTEDMYRSLIDNIVIPSEGVVEHIRGYSQPAINALPDSSLDLIYIDAVHDFPNVWAEIRLAWPKMKPGGIIAGHDYSPQFPGCVQAVDFYGGPQRVFTDTSWMIRVP